MCHFDIGLLNVRLKSEKPSEYKNDGANFNAWARIIFVIYRTVLPKLRS